MQPFLRCGDSVLQDGHVYVLQVSVARNPTVQRRQNHAERSAAPEASGGERDACSRVSSVIEVCVLNGTCYVFCAFSRSFQL